MGELQATVEFSVELYKFYNVDLFQRGYYQIRTYLKVSPKLPVKIEVSLPQNPRTELVFPACVVNGSAVSKTFQILYRNEEVSLDDVALFKVHIIVDSHKIEETIERADFQLVVELWFTDQSFGPDQHSSIQCMSSRTLNLHFTCSKGLHHHLPVLFDYFHLSAVAMTIHASLVAVHQPYINTSKPTRPGGWLLNSPRINNKLQSSSIENVLFGSSSKSGLSSVRLSHARQVHREICSVLLSAYENLQHQLQECMKLLPPWQQLKIETTDCYSRLHNLSDSAKSVDSEDDLIAIANSDIAQLCAENIILWQQFLEVFTLKDRIRQHLAREHHLQRVKRFAEGFFVIEHPSHALLSCSDAGYQNYQTIADATRKSRYFSMLPPLAVECVDMDGSVDMLPIIFEDQYQSSRNLSKTGRHSDPGVNVNEINVNLKRTYRTDRHHSLQTTTRLSVSDASTPRQYRSPSVDTTSVSVSKSTPLQVERIKESRSLNADMNAAFATMSSPVASWLLRNETDKEMIEILDKTPLMPEVSRSSLKLDLRNVDKNSDLPVTSVSGAVSPRSIKNKLRNKLGKVNNIFKGNGTGQLVIPSGLNPGSPSMTSSNDSVVLMSYKKLEQSVSLPHNLTAHLSLPRQISTATCRYVDSDNSSKFHIAKSMPNFPTNVDLNNLSAANSESMPDLASNASPIHSTTNIQPDDILSWPSTSLMEASPDTTTDIDIHNQSLDEIPPLPPEFIDSVISEATSTLAEAISLRDQPGSSSATTCNSDLPSEPSLEGLTSFLEDRRKSASSVESQKAARRSGKTRSLPPSNGSKHIYEEIHLPPEEFRDPPVGGDGKKTPINSKDKEKRRGSGGKTDFVDKSTRRSSGESQTNLKLPTNLPWDNHRRGVASLPVPDEVTCPCTRQEYIADVLKSINRDGVRSSYLDAECTLFEMLTECADYEEDGDAGDKRLGRQENDHQSVIPPLPVRKCSQGKAPVCSPEEFFNWEDVDNKSKQKLNLVTDSSVSFVKAKEEFKRQLPISAILYSDFPTLASTIPYFHVSEDFRIAYSSGLHLIICVHGLDGNSADLRLVKTYLELGLPGSNLDFLMSEHNQGDTFSDFETMTDKLISEIISHIEMYSINPSKISFIGHSLGNIIIRSALARPEMKPWLGRLHTFLSLSGPHLGTLYNNSGLVNMGMWFMQKWKKSGSLLQLSMKDSPNMRQTFLYKLSQRPGLQYFKNVLLFGSSQDRYVPIHSARIELCKAALKDITLQGTAYREMVHNLLEPALNRLDITFIRYDVHHALPNTPNSIIGRAAHIAVLDSELFIEKFLTVCGLKYFR